MRAIVVLCFALLSCTLSGQDAPFTKGVNLTNWFQVGNAKQIQFSKYTKQDFENIQGLGCDVIRLPINLHFMTDGAPDYVLDPLFLSFLDEAVNWAEELGLHLILDNHTFNPAEDTDPNIGDILEKVWIQMATHFKDRSDLVYYEVLNEPHGISDALWNSIQQQIVTAIRTIDTRHTIVIGPASWNSYNNLSAMPIYQDDNLLYTFHFYDPFIFTHQGASWVGPSMEPLADVPFPYEASMMPSFPSALNGSWIQSAFNNYNEDGQLSAVKSLIDIAVDFRSARNVPIYCGEFGVYIPNSQQEDRVYWYAEVRKYLEEQNIAWTMWDYHGGFGLFNAGGNDLFEHDVNTDLVAALGLNVPTQTAYEIKPDTVGFYIYSDYIGENIFEASYNEGEIDFYNTNLPNNDSYSLFWTDAKQYNNIGFDFKPDKDLSYLLANDFALDFYVKGDTPGTSFDIRFIDTKTIIPNDRPWRMGLTISDNNPVSWDNTWQHVHIPLRDFMELGAWDDGWFNPIGAFDWSAVDRIEIVAEQAALAGTELWFDNIQLTDIDPTMVDTKGRSRKFDFSLFPNPAHGQIKLNYTGPGTLQYQLLDIQGRSLQGGELQGEKTIPLDGMLDGLYFLLLRDHQGATEVHKMMKQSIID